MCKGNDATVPTSGAQPTRITCHLINDTRIVFNALPERTGKLNKVSQVEQHIDPGSPIDVLLARRNRYGDLYG